MPLEKTCTITGQKFLVTDEELALRAKMGIPGTPEHFPAFRLMQLGAFWQHWHLHARKCDKTSQDLFSVFSSDCPYPVWHRDEWITGANPPGVDFDASKPIFPQLWGFFQHSPIPHNMGVGSENCEYTDDWWYGKNCYLCHNGLNCEDTAYTYRGRWLKDSQFCTFSFQSELCIDTVNCFNGYHLVHSVDCRQCRDSAFLYDCRNCHDCMFCWNLRNKEYCFQNVQLTQEEYEKKKETLTFTSYRVYTQAIAEFRKIMYEKAQHRALYNDKCEKVDGNYNRNGKNLTNSYFTDDSEDCVNCVRGVSAKDALDCVAAVVGSELSYCCALVQDKCYASKFAYNLNRCSYCEYCGYCLQCEHCFGCCGLVNKKYYIFNKQYTKEQYEELLPKIIAHMKATGEYGSFFPGSFAANPYENSLSGYHWPLNREMQQKFGFRIGTKNREREPNYLDIEEIPDDSRDAIAELSREIFWDEKAQRPFQIRASDIAFARKLGVPLPHSFYLRRLQENFDYMPFDGTLRETICGKCSAKIKTSWPKAYDGHILCEDCYTHTVA